MARKNSPQYVINSYQRKQKILPFIIWGIAAIIFGAGILILILWFSGGENGGFGALGSLFASKTPTPTETATMTATVPSPTPTMTLTETMTPTPTLTPTPDGPIEYVVEDGDNCWLIAADKFKVNVELFMALNGMTTCNIKPGQTVLIPPPDMKMPTETPFPLENYTTGQQFEYTIQMNDTFQLIASKFNTTVEMIMKNNEIKDPASPLRAGAKLIISVNIVTPTITPVPTYTEMPTG